MIKAQKLYYSYEFDDETTPALDGVSLDIAQGEFVALLGHNGCGKSTLARHLNALLEVQQGELTVAGINARLEAEVWRIRRRVGMVFQNPDNQFVSSIVHEDVAFGLENYGVPRSEIHGRVTDALQAVGMEAFELRRPHTLSGGQKQRVALAGVLALSPDVLVFDEVTAMLDPEGRREILNAIRELHSAGKTIVMISHYIEEAVYADTVCLIHDGRILARGTPREMLSDTELLAATGLTPPVCVRMYHDLKADGIDLGRCPLTNEELTEAICRLL